MDGTISKHIDEVAMQRLKKGSKIAKDILIKAGVKPKDIFVNKELGGHPGGSVALGTHLDDYCQTKIPNCYLLSATTSWTLFSATTSWTKVL